MNALVLCLALCCASPEESSPLHIQADDGPTRVVVRYRIPPERLVDWKQAIEKNAAQDPRRWLSLRLFETGLNRGYAEAALPPIIGDFEIRDGYLLFRPRFGLTPGVRYRASVVQPWDSETVAGATYDVPPNAPQEPATVTYVFPKVEEIPANLLKFRISFSRSMRQGRETFERIHLLDHAGNEIHAPWRDIELWDSGSRTLSLYIHPGRIKQGVNLREQLGPVLEPGKIYTLVIDAALRDATGAPLGKEFRKSFKAGPEVHKKVDVAAWKIEAPAAGTLKPVVITFDRPLEVSVFTPSITLVDPDGNPISINTGYTDQWFAAERSSREPWKAGTYRVAVNPKMTDLAGNTPHTVFDRDLDDRSHDPSEGPIERTFTIR